MEISKIDSFLVPLSSSRLTLAIQLTTREGWVEWDAAPVGTSINALDPAIFDIDDAKEYATFFERLIKGTKFYSQQQFDDALESLLGENSNGGINGANFAFCCSSSFGKLFARSNGVNLHEHINTSFNTKMKTPNILCNFFGGGLHHKNMMKVTEMMLLGPFDCFEKNLFYMLKVRDIVSKKLSNFYIGLEGCFVTNNMTDKDALQCLCTASLSTGVSPRVAVDIAGILTIEEILRLDDAKNIIYVEDPVYPFSPNSAFIELLASDDISAPGFKKLKEVLNDGAFNSIVLKANHWGTLTRLFKASSIANKFGLRTVLSQRSQETGRDTMAEIAFGLGVDFIKFGSPARERISVYSQLLSLYRNYGY